MNSFTFPKASRKPAWRRWFFIVVLIVVLCLNGIGLFFGNLLYQEASMLNSHLNDQRLEQFKHRMRSDRRNSEWTDIVIASRFGYPLHGTYIPNAQATDKTLVFLHGFTENRAVGLSYLDVYLDAGFNILLVDSRAHGESGGNSVTWGSYEKYDLEQWVAWVSERFPSGVIGVHGISMGAATALMHAELNETDKRVAFYVADSAYSDLEELLTLQMQRLFPEIAMPWLLLQYANVVAYLKSRFTFREASPIRSVRHVTTPVLYIHGAADKLVPPSMSEALYRATKGPRQLVVFPNTEHIAAIFDDRYRYRSVVRRFVDSIDQQS